MIGKGNRSMSTTSHPSQLNIKHEFAEPKPILFSLNCKLITPILFRSSIFLALRARTTLGQPFGHDERILLSLCKNIRPKFILLPMQCIGYGSIRYMSRTIRPIIVPSRQHTSLINFPSHLILPLFIQAKKWRPIGTAHADVTITLRITICCTPT